MKLGIIRGYSAADFDFVKKNELEFIEVCCNFDPDIENFLKNKESIKENIKRTGIPIQSVGRWNMDCNIGGKIDPERFKFLASLLDAAIEVGSPNFVCGCNYASDATLYRNYTAAIELFGRLLERAGGKTNICVYNCDWENFVHSDAQWKVVLGELPELKIKFDSSHSFGRRSDYLAELSDWGDRIGHMHVKGAVRAGSRGIDDPPAGMDALRWSEIFAILYSRGYTGGLSIEPHSSAWRADIPRGERGILFARDFIRRFLVD
ncbi:MAG: sugar phosphate isomerase/epimerase family protein [Eubacteriales bacterium]|jgi:sugar phosphate isomerase/epimerase